ncbi:hypothetical protein PXK30_03620 [Phaeobacter gallaeciensis]|uniref:BRCT domain-containing protein n=1 Tax=Phaeobacter gallaeciensis TaxID=60890 RepID=UPI00237F19EC|nr:BRCT domain-containing protein [Phaeobacter gallaeciensis]MDE4303997.1 hypothetical protein [Phaeobacter gallaeciensis]MDE4309057.1 hypothetical protein [Phaeobacter gallaeciensis]MDE4313389.1 hypothetical protein [Phaeobacter gallaeciensis]MDE4317986.1 hypothetical protein [Phaeobacter gallaeciensis]MDE4322449.1 hypothetical protein [Phaeobacter gallaeciensis]
MEVTVKSSSSGNEYRIVILQEQNGVSLSCNCPAGATGGFCKHRFALIDGNTKDVVAATGDVGTIPSMVKGTELEAAINRMHDQERAIKDAQADLKQIKKMVGRVMLGNQRKPHEAEIRPRPLSDDFDPDDMRVLTGKTVVFSGTFDKISRAEAKRLAEANGARVAGNISPKSDLFVCGRDAGSKEIKARDLGVKTISEIEFLALIG